MVVSCWGEEFLVCVTKAWFPTFFFFFAVGPHVKWSFPSTETNFLRPLWVFIAGFVLLHFVHMLKFQNHFPK
jgi:hypothetical protein